MSTNRLSVEDEFDELFRVVWDAYPGVQPATPILPPPDDVANLDHNRPQPEPLRGSRYLQSSPPNRRISRAIRPLPPTPGASVAASPRRSISDLDGESNRRLPPAPRIRSYGGLLQAGSESQPDQPWNHSLSSRAGLLDEETSSIYPGYNTPALPLYVRDESPPPSLPPVPSYDDSQQSLSKRDTDSFPPSISELHTSNAVPLANVIEEEPDTVSPVCAPDQPASTHPSEAVQDRNNDQNSVSDLSYIDSPPRQRAESVRNSFPASPTSSSPSISANNRRHSLPRVVSFGPSSQLIIETDDYIAPGPSNLTRRITEVLRDIRGRGPLGLHDIIAREYPSGDSDSGEEEEDEDDRFVKFAFLSNLAVQLRDKVPQTTHVKGGVPYPNAFTGKDIVTTIQSLIVRELVLDHGGSTTDRRAALHIARSLQAQLFFCEVEWGARLVQDGVEDVYMFMDEAEGSSGAPREALPSSIITVMANCYSPSCGEGRECYAYGCPRKGDSLQRLLPEVMEVPSSGISEDWARNLSPQVLRSLPESEVKRQTIINKLISKEEHYIRDLDVVDSVFIKPLRAIKPAVIKPSDRLEVFIEEVFSNILEIRECNRRLLEILHVRQREQAPVIQRVGDILLDAATEFRRSYPAYVGNHPLAEKRLRDELENNSEFRIFIENCSRRQSSRNGTALRLNLRHFLNRPPEHLQKYPFMLKAILEETARGDPDADYLSEAIEAIKNLRDMAQLRTFQSAMGRGPTANWQWQDLLSTELRRGFTIDEIRRQSAIFELIKGEMVYVKNLENIESMYIHALRNTEPPILPPERLEQFMKDVFYNFAELHAYHRRLMDALHVIQREEHPRIRSIIAAVLDAALNFRDAYLEYIPNYPIAAYRIDEEMNINLAFRAFAENCVRHPDAHRLTMKDFLNCPIPRLLEYEHLLREIYDSTRRDHPDRDEIPEVIDIIKELGRETEPGVNSSKQKVRLWQYNGCLVFKPGEVVDLDLLNESRSLIHTGKLLQQPETAAETWTELFVLLFDNYLVMTKAEEQHGVTKYVVVRRPIPLDLLVLVSFTDPARRQRPSLLNSRRSQASISSTSSYSGGQAQNGDSRTLYPFTIHHNGRLGGAYNLCADSSQIRLEWKQKLEEATGLRRVVQESNKVFEIETLSMHTFSVLPGGASHSPSLMWNEGMITGKVVCSIPFDTPDGRKLVAVGCAEGVWIGFRQDSTSLRRVLHLRMVTQCTMLEEFGLFLVLSDKQLFAYHIEALAPTPNQTSTASQAPQKVSGNKEVSFFTVGKMLDRTYVIYMRKKGTDSYFHVLEPILGKIYDRPKAPTGMFGFFQPAKSDWFKTFKEFRLSSDTFDLVFLKSRVAILTANGFEIMDLNDNKSVVIPHSDPCLIPLEQRYESRRPIGIFKTREDGFLLCYTQFGIYVDKQGVPNRHATHVEWEGIAESVAFHAPYILLFDSRFIEVRHVDTGRLSQIIPGTDVRCVWDGRGFTTNCAAVPGTQSDDEMVQEAHVHAVVTMPEQPAQVGRASRPIMQHIFELIPTIPLYLPGSLASPPTMTYFLSSSPPRSPLRPTTSYM